MDNTLFFHARSTRVGRLSCHENYSLESGETVAVVECSGGKWETSYWIDLSMGRDIVIMTNPILEDTYDELTTITTSPSDEAPRGIKVTAGLYGVCSKTCREDCLNGGICIARNTCSCSEGFKGTFCEFENCEDMTIENGRIEERFVKNSIFLSVYFFLSC